MLHTLRTALILSIFYLSQTLFAQDYFNKVIPFDFGNPNAAKIELHNENILIPVIYPGAQSTLIEVDAFGYAEYYHISNFDFAYKSLSTRNDQLYAFAKDRELEKGLLLGQLDEDYTFIWQNKIETKGQSNFPSTSIATNNGIYNSFRYEGQDNLVMGICLTSYNGEMEWVKYYFENEKSSTPYNMIYSEDGKLLVALTLKPAHTFNVSYPLIMKIDQNGDIVWQSNLFDNYDYGSVKLTELSNGQILLSYNKDMWLDPDVQCCYDPYTPTFVWLDSLGRTIEENLFLIPHYNEISVTNIERGNGEYFFSYGIFTVDPPGPNPDGDNFYGFITKYSNAGDTIWSKRYRHPEYNNSLALHDVEDIIELDNGDIFAMGEITPVGEKSEIWIFKLNEDGCFNSINCDDEVQMTTSANSLSSQNQERLSIFPNPAKDIIHIDGILDRDISRISVFDIAGANVLRVDPHQRSIDISNLPIGVYAVQITFINGDYSILRIIKTN